jgi:hypothetical protein
MSRASKFAVLTNEKINSMKKVFRSALLIGFLSISASMMSKDRDFRFHLEKQKQKLYNLKYPMQKMYLLLFTTILTVNCFLKI